MDVNIVFMFIELNIILFFLRNIEVFFSLIVIIFCKSDVCYYNMRLKCLVLGYNGYIYCIFKEYLF